jgi:hypothetical protein
MRRIFLFLVGALPLSACSDSSGSSAAPAWTSTTTQVGDTTVVRTTGVTEPAALLDLVPGWSIGSLDGDSAYMFGMISELAVGPADDILVFDRQTVKLSQYDSTGKYIRKIGGRGSGPGEYERINGLAVHDDERVVLWNATIASVTAYSPAAELLGNWIVPGGTGFNTSGSLYVDTAGNTYVRTRVGDPPPSDNMATSGRMFGITGLLRYDRSGAVRDSLRPPEIILDAPRLVASVEGNTSMTNVPFSPRFVWTVSPFGAFVSGRSDVYRVDITGFDGKVLRIEMDGERVPVNGAEKEDIETVTTANMRSTDPNWKWNGAPIPDVKPYYKAISVDRDGRVWVSLSRPGELIPVEELPEERVEDGVRFPVRKWREPSVYDVFERNGTYMGRIAMPPRATWSGARGEHVWAIVRDSLDLEHIARFTIAQTARR